MTGRTEIDPSTKKRQVSYFCSSYIAGKSNGQRDKCRAYRITHTAAEQLLLEKLKELNLSYDNLKNAVAQENVADQVVKLGREDLAMDEQYRQLVREGIEALEAYYRGNKTVSSKTLKRLKADAEEFYTYPRSGMADSLRKKLEQVERESVLHAKQKVESFMKELASYTHLIASAENRPAQKKIIDQKCNELEAQIQEWEARKQPITARLTEAYDRWNDIGLKIYDLGNELPLLDQQARGEALRRVFKTVKLKWDAEFIPAQR